MTARATPPQESPVGPIRSDAVPTQPWKNGGGLMRELLVWPHTGDWRARVGVADIAADGPFSDFPGVERWFVVLKGAGVELTVGASAHRLTRIAAPLRFDGGAATRCMLLAGPVQALNLMLNGARGGIEIVHDGEPWTPPAGACGLFTAVAGRCGEVELPHHALLWFDVAPARLVFEAGERPACAVGWWLTAAPLAQAAAPPKGTP